MSDQHPGEEEGQLLKLSVFPVTFSPEEVLVHGDDFPLLREGDILEIYQPDNVRITPRLLLQVSPNTIYTPPVTPVPSTQGNSASSNKNLSRETIYVEKSIAETFKLQNFKDVLVRCVQKSDLVLDTVELTFRDQYLGRSEMWQIKSILIDTVVFKNKKVDFCNGKIRFQVNEMWQQGSQLACGVVTSETKIVYRSPTAMIYLFIQMSSEMWDFDHQGNLYYEKAVNGFLKEMFDRWKRFGALHEVTIVLFSRCFYETKDKSEFPRDMLECLQTGINGKFYEDFYRVVVQNERFEDWSKTLMELQKYFTTYKDHVLNYHANNLDPSQQDKKIPQAQISTADQGNFLEVLNMSLNTFENHYLNRNVDRTGQQSIVITPGVGIFEVDRDLAQITKQRVIDSGVGLDLICVGEQPLHAVPLFKFHSKLSRESEKTEQYSMPHWINLSFYSYQHNPGQFQPRIKIPAHFQHRDPKDLKPILFKSRTQPITPEEMNAYDAQVFKKPERRVSHNGTEFEPDTSWNRRKISTEKRMSTSGATRGPYPASGVPEIPTLPDSRGLQGFSAGLGTLETSVIDEDEDDSADEDSLAMITRSYKSSLGFQNYHPNSGLKQNRNSTPRAREEAIKAATAIEKLNTSVVGTSNIPFDHQAIKRLLLGPGRALINPFDPNHTTMRVTSNRRRWTHIFPKGPSGTYTQIHDKSSHFSPGSEQLNSGVDWKSLTIPGSLPITTDFIPDGKTLDEEFLFNEYNISPTNVMSDFGKHSLVSTGSQSDRQVFLEFISQRLAHGFQLIINPPEGQNFKKESFFEYCNAAQASNEVWLSIGKLYHRIRLSSKMDEVNVTILRPRHPILNLGIEYRYRFQAPDNDTYEVSWVKFKTEKLENYNWNHMDYHVATKTGIDFPLNEKLKYWRLRMFLLPLTPFQTVTKAIAEDKDDPKCDKYNTEPWTLPESCEGFFRFIDSCLNKVKRKGMPEHSKTEEVNTEILSESSSLSEIVKAMKSPQTGLPFFSKTTGLLAETFLTYDAIQWLTENGFKDKEKALKLCQELLSKKLIRHASGRHEVPFKVGYIFFSLVDPDVKFPYQGDIEAFRNDWVEVEVVSRRKIKPGFVFCHRELDQSNKANKRLEWMNLRYQTEHSLDTSYEFVFNWTVATGSLIADLAHAWARKAQQCSYAMMAIPRDPFALPITLNSDPVRGPIFVEMETSFVTQNSPDKKIDEELALFMLREAIVKKFGFIPCTSNSEILKERGPNHHFSTDNQYVHCTGNMFVLIPTKIEQQSGIQGLKLRPVRVSESSLNSAAKEDSEDRQEVINRHLSVDKPQYDHSKTGFLWSWNFMISKRWKNITTTGATGDIEFMDKMLLDFRKFCANTDGRLEKFWTEFSSASLTAAFDI